MLNVLDALAAVSPRFVVEVELANSDDEAAVRAGGIPEEHTRRAMVTACVGGRVTRLVIPEWVVEKLGLTIVGQTEAHYPDGRIAQRSLVRVGLTWGGRSSVFNAVAEPDRDSAHIGAIVLEDLDVVANSVRRTLVPVDPGYITADL